MSVGATYIRPSNVYCQRSNGPLYHRTRRALVSKEIVSFVATFLLSRSPSHDICFPLQLLIIVNSYPFRLQRHLNPSLLLLYYMPCFMRQMLFLPWPHMDLRTLGVGQRLYLGRFGGVIMHLYIVQRYAGEVLNTSFESIRQSSVIFLRGRIDRDAIK